jgi:hypothetical protein
MFRDLLGKHDRVLDVLEYDQLDRLLAGFKYAVVIPTLNKRDELRLRKKQTYDRSAASMIIYGESDSRSIFFSRAGTFSNR